MTRRDLVAAALGYVARDLWERWQQHRFERRLEEVDLDERGTFERTFVVEGGRRYRLRADARGLPTLAPADDGRGVDLTPATLDELRARGDL